MEIKAVEHGRCMQTETYIHINPKRGFEHVTCCHQCCPPLAAPPTAQTMLPRCSFRPPGGPLAVHPRRQHCGWAQTPRARSGPVHPPALPWLPAAPQPLPPPVHPAAQTPAARCWQGGGINSGWGEMPSCCGTVQCAAFCSVWGACWPAQGCTAGMPRLTGPQAL